MKRRIVKILAGIIFIPLLSLCLIGGAGYALLQTDGGRTFLSRQIEDVASSEDGISLQISGLEGNVFGHFQIAEIRLKDPKGDWLAIKNADLNWSPLDLLGGIAQVENISADLITVIRQPELPPAAEEASSGSGFALPLKIRLKRFFLAQLDLKEELFGLESSLQVALNLNSRNEDELQSELKITPLDGGGDFVSGDVIYSLRTQRLGVFTEIVGKKDGLFSRILALPNYPAINASLTGDGPISNWQGQMTVNADGVLAGDLLLLTKGDKVIAAEISGGVQVHQNIASGIPLLDNTRITLDANLLFDPSKSHLTLQTATIKNDILALDAAGSVALETFQMAGQANLSLLKMAPVNDLITPASLSDVVVATQFSGNLDNLRVTTNLTAKGIAVAGGGDVAPIHISAVEGDFSADLALQELTQIPFTGDVSFRDLSGLPKEAATVIGSLVTLTTKGAYSLSDGALDLQHLKVGAGHLGLNAEGRLFAGAGPTVAELVATLDDLKALQPTLGGATRVEVKLTSSDLTQNLNSNVKAVISGFDMGNPDLQKLTGQNVTLNADIVLVGDMMTIDGQLPLKIGTITAQSIIPTAFDTFTAQIQAALPRLEAMSELAGIPLQGASDLTLQLDGALNDPDATAHLSLVKLSVDGRALGDVKANITAKSIVTALQGNVTGEVRNSPLAMDFETNFDLTDQSVLKIRNAAITQPGNRVKGDMVIPLDGAAMTGQVDADLSNFESLSAFISVPIKGRLNLAAQFDPAAKGQGVLVTADGTVLQAGPDYPTVESVTLKLEARDAFANPEFKADVQAVRIENQGTQFGTIRLMADGGMSDVNFQFKAANDTEFPYQLGGDGKLTLADQSLNLILSALSGSLAGQNIALQRPLDLVKNGDDIRVAPFTVAIGTGRLSGDAAILPEQASANLSIQSLPLNWVRSFRPDLPLSGQLNANAVLNVMPEASRGQVSAELANVTLEGPDYENIPPLFAHLKGELDEDQLTVKADVTGLEETVVTGAGQIPVKVNFSPLSVEVSEVAPISGSFNLNSRLDKIWPLLGLDRHLLSGVITANAALSGSLGTPEIKGQAELKNGRYEEIELGTIIEQLHLSAAVRDMDKIALEVTGTDGEKGSLHVAGIIDLADLAKPAVDISAKMQGMTVMRQDLVTVVTNADLAARGNTDALLASGNITTETIEIDISSSTGPSVAEIEVTEVNFPNQYQRESALKSSEQAMKVNLDIGIQMPRRVFIRGRGLDSEWEGALAVKGNASNPVISGKLSPVRGQFTFAGKSFELQEGAVLLRGQGEIDPELSLAAQYNGPDVTAIVRIEGSASNPVISFTSPDGLPQDEVLARVLFGKSAAKLSGMEALQLAQAVVEVSGGLGGGGGGIMGFARQAIGVDVLSAGVNEETGNAELSVGKYITDNIYVGVAQGATAGSTSAKVEIELTPNIKVESKTDQTSNSSVGVFWKWDY